MIIDSISLREHKNGGRAVSATIFMIWEISPNFPYHKKRSAMDAHSRDRNMLPSATALGARMSQATFFLV